MKIFVNLPVKDLPATMAFWRSLGYTFNEQFTDDIYAMLLTHAKFKEFTPKSLCDSTKSTEVILCLSCESRGAVDELVTKAASAGGSSYAKPKDHGFMYQHGFEDLDGHIWELVYMEPGAVQ